MCLDAAGISVMSPILYSCRINDVENGVKSMLMKFTDAIKLGGDANSTRAAKQYKGT